MYFPPQKSYFKIQGHEISISVSRLIPGELRIWTRIWGIVDSANYPDIEDGHGKMRKWTKGMTWGLEYRQDRIAGCIAL